MVSIQEQVQDLRQTIMESPDTFQYSCFHLEHKGKRINDFVELSEVEEFAPGSQLRLVEDPYTEKEARMHLLRTREIIGAASERTDSIYGVSAGLSLHDNICPWKGPEAPAVADGSGPSPSANISGNPHALDDFKFDAPPNLRTLLSTEQGQTPKTVKSLGISSWNPPPPFLRQQGHLLYVQLTTNEGEQYHITSHISGFFVNKSSNNKFDPFPRLQPKQAFSHSLFSLISDLSPAFRKAFGSLQEFNNRRDPLANFQLTNAIPSCPWLVESSFCSLSKHSADLTRSQETYLMGGAENTESLRDWNEEIQNTKELPRETVQDRIFRERLISKIYAEFNDAAARGAVLVARDEVAPLNPTESKDAQIFVWNNIFYSFGADGVGTFASEGGDEAARVAVSKDVAGVKAVNQLDIDKVATPGTIIVDYLGKRLVAQSIVPGIFKQREPEENQVDYGGVEGRDVVADNEAFVPIFSQVSKALKVKRHSVWDKEGKEHVLEASVETKGLLGTDGRKYILDLYRLTPLDILWIAENQTDSIGDAKNDEGEKYPHRMTVLRQELVDAYWRLKLNEFVTSQLQDRQESTKKISKAADADSEVREESTEKASDVAVNGTETSQTPDSKEGQDHVDLSAFTFTLNPDVFCGQVPQTEEQRAELAKDEDEVRKVCSHLREKVLPELLHDLKEGEVGFPMDGQSLSALMHKRGINIRYLGRLANQAGNETARMQALCLLAIQEMIARCFKHIANRHLKDIPSALARNCLAHLLNCLLGYKLNADPKADLSEDISVLYPDAKLNFSRMTPSSLQLEIVAEVRRRFRFDLPMKWAEDVKHIQLLRSVILKLGVQLVEREYHFFPIPEGAGKATVRTESPLPLAVESNGLTNGHAASTKTKKKKKTTGQSSPTAPNEVSELASSSTTFVLDDIANTVPIVKDATPKSKLAEEALEAGRISMMQNQKEVGQELLLESLTLHEQIYGILHPEVARVYHQLALLYYQLEEKSAAIELAHKAVIISERTLGVDSSETVHAYLNLALFEHGNRNTAVALSYVRHALELWKIVYGPNHPDCTTTLNNAAVMLQNLQAYQKSRLWFELSLGISEEISGKSSVSTATLLFQLAQALVLDGDHKGAVQRMREAYSIFLAKLGPQDANTKESEKWLEQLTQNAVSMAKHAKDVQARRVRRIMLNPRANVASFSSPQPSLGQPSSAGSPTPSSVNLTTSSNRQDLQSNRDFDSRSIDELMKFIEGGGDVSKTASSKKRSARGNPRRRGGGGSSSTATPTAIGSKA